MIKVKNLVKSYGDAKILDDINLNIKDGEFVSIIGPSGCGKSTLINIISGLSSKSSGKVFVENEEITKTSVERIMVFQNAALFPWLTVYDNIAFGLKSIIKDSEEIKKKVIDVLRKVHLYKYKEKYPHELSGGMKQRVSIARSIVMDPKILLMDEPFSALDEQTRMLLHNELQEIWIETKKTIVFVTHNIREAVKLSDRVLVMGTRPGTIIDDIEIKDSHPRELNSPGLIYKEKQVYEKLKVEIEKVAKEELGDEYELEKANISSVHNNTMGGGI